ncbi:MAG: glycosyltransferase family 2 protein [Rhodospirillaceae bacterium]|nr:glycosyltransferase family 2 protein [Rhodospirillaceae bacterium]
MCVATTGENNSNRIVPEHDKELVLLLPENDTPDPELSIVIPAMNEETVVGEFMDWCHEGIKKAGVTAEILIVSSSTDRTAEIALAKGARVLEAPRRGLGRAYIDAIPLIRGKYAILGDADLTYDFRKVGPFIERFREGFEYVMGSRFEGSIEDGAMPGLHRYFGTPLTTFILNVIYGTKFTDIHCGMRGITLDAFKRLNLQSQSWEYASEMVVKSVRMGLKTSAVPVHFYKDREGRVSHHKREGWFSPWHAGWINLRAMLIHGADFFVLKPGLALFVLGLFVTLGMAGGPITINGVTLSLNTMLAGSAVAILGLQCIFLGAIAQTLYDPSGAAQQRWLTLFSYTRTMVASGLLFCIGMALGINFIAAYIDAGYVVFGNLVSVNHLAVAGFLAVILSFQTFVSTLLFHAVTAYIPKKESVP